MNHSLFFVASLLILLSAGTISFAFNHPVTLAGQGSFMAGGSVIETPGTYDSSHPTDPAGQTYHGDHAYVFWQNLSTHGNSRLSFSMAAVNQEKAGKPRRMAGMGSKIYFSRTGTRSISLISRAVDGPAVEWPLLLSRQNRMKDFFSKHSVSVPILISTKGASFLPLLMRWSSLSAR